MMLGGIIEAYRAHKERKEKPLEAVLAFYRYIIKPAVDELGNPTYELRRAWVNGFCSSNELLAKNQDKAVLERAIEHLQSEG